MENTAFTIQLKVRTNETLTQAQSLQPQKCSVTWTNDILMQCFKTNGKRTHYGRDGWTIVRCTLIWPVLISKYSGVGQ